MTGPSWFREDGPVERSDGRYFYREVGMMGGWWLTPAEAQAMVNRHGNELIGGFVCAIVRRKEGAL